MRRQRVWWMLAVVLVIALAQAGVASACGYEDDYDEDYEVPSEVARVQDSADIFVGRVLSTEVLEHKKVDDRELKLVMARVLIEETLKGDTEHETLATFYLLVESSSSTTPKAGEKKGSNTAPRELARFVFFARPYSELDSSFVLAANTDDYMSPLDGELVAETRLILDADARGKLDYYR